MRCMQQRKGMVGVFGNYNFLTQALLAKKRLEYMKTPDTHFRTQIPSKVCHTSLGYQSSYPWCGIFEAKQLPDYGLVGRIVVD